MRDLRDGESNRKRHRCSANVRNINFTVNKSTKNKLNASIP